MFPVIRIRQNQEIQWFLKSSKNIIVDFIILGKDLVNMKQESKRQNYPNSLKLSVEESPKPKFLINNLPKQPKKSALVMPCNDKTLANSPKYMQLIRFNAIILSLYQRSDKTFIQF